MTSVPSSDPLVTALADRYCLLRELGAGGMATVYLAEDVKHGNAPALATDAFLAPLRQDPRHTALLKRVGLR